MQLFTREDANNIDRLLVDEIGFSIDMLIEHAAIAVAGACMEILTADKNIQKDISVEVIAGKGMNGSDAFSCARILHSKGFRVFVREVFPANDSTQKKICQNSGVFVSCAKDYVSGGNQLIVDGVFGTAFEIKREIPVEIKDLFEKISTSKKEGSAVLSVDIPSGVDPNTGEATDWAIFADKTVTFIKPKVGIISYPGRLHAGEIIIDNIGIPKEVLEKIKKSDMTYEQIDSDLAKMNLKLRPQDGHKRIFGKVGLIGGSKGMAGAICLSGIAALKSGCGLVYIRVPSGITGDCLSLLPEALISSDYANVFENSDVLVIGPGMDSNPASKKSLQHAIETIPKLILDATALNILSEFPKLRKESFAIRKKSKLPFAILTPHQGEFDRLFPELKGTNRVESAIIASQKMGVVMVLKGAGTIVCDGSHKTYINTTGNSSMAKGGSGDVLAGIIAAIYATMPSPELSAALAVFIHGMSGDISALEYGEYSATPTDTIKKLPDVFKLISDKGDDTLCLKPF